MVLGESSAFGACLAKEITILKRRVVITGLGLVTPLANSAKATWSALMRGESGVDFIKRFETDKFNVKIAAEVKDFTPPNYPEGQMLRDFGACTHYAVRASDEAVLDSRLRITAENSERVGVYISSAVGDFEVIERERAKFLAEGPECISPAFIRNFFINFPASMVSVRHRAQGPNSTAATACAAGTHAVGDSFKIIQRGDADVMICGGAEAIITPMCVAGFAALRALSTRNDEPKRASRPFERDRDGFVLGEGAGILVLEELQTALDRGAHIYAEIIGYGMTGDARHITMPDETASGAVRAMQRALSDGGVEPERLDYINAHGTSTPFNDKYETIAIKSVFGAHAYKLAVSSTKSMTGHLLGATGGVEAAFSVLSIENQHLPPTINYENPDPECDLDFIPNQARSAVVRYVLSNSFGFGGTNATLLFKRFEE
jgi:3-oxoacyl-[acyl-carrier-protein] synthase II